MIANLFNTNILNKPENMNRYRLDTQKKSDSTYFSRHVKIIAQERTNSIIVLGRAQAVTRIKEFIHHYLDVEQDSGKSILHVFQLQYRDAPLFAEVLKNIVQSKQAEGTEQTTTEGKRAAGPQRYFDEVLIAIDTPSAEGAEEEGSSSALGEEGAGPIIRKAKYYGGNKLIIAARGDDWKRLKKLIEKLDQPEPQVLIEVLIADLTLDDSRQLGTLFRNPAKLPMPGATNFQSAHLQPGVMPDSFGSPNTVGVIENSDGSIEHASDLLRQFFIDPATGQRSDTGDPLTTVAQQMPAGSTILSLSDKDGQTFGITQILKLLDNTKILSHPHVISTNNKSAKIEITEIRLLRDQASGSQGGTIVVQNKNIPASLKVYITPRISISDIRENTVNLQVTIDINEYKSTTSDTRITRNVTTNATVVTGDVLALGGLIRTNETDTLRETPILSKIPIIGWLFKKRAKSNQRTNLTVFISPTIIEPRLRGGVGEYTRDYLNITREYANSGNLFDSLKDPITRWFFKEESATEKFTKDFMKYENNEPKPSMPQSEVTKSGKKPVLVQAGSPAEPNIIIEQQKAQIEQLKDLFQDMDNPFAHVEQPQNMA
jgi:type II secretory pathway component GspD/PulD (secretin)